MYSVNPCAFFLSFHSLTASHPFVPAIFTYIIPSATEESYRIGTYTEIWPNPGILPVSPRKIDVIDIMIFFGQSRIDAIILP